MKRGFVTAGTLLATLLSGCSGRFPSTARCTDNSQCQEGEVCFPEGCADPGKNLVVEVVANSRTGHHAQDLAIAEVTPTQDLKLTPPITLSGELQRYTSASQTGATPYDSPVTLRVQGESVLIPGVMRSYDQTFTNPQGGAYSIFVGAGRYVATAVPSDAAIPPDAHPVELVTPGKSQDLTFAFASQDATVPLTGTVLRQRLQGTPPIDSFVTQAAMELLAIDPVTHRSLAQPAAIASGYPGSKGGFTLSLDPSVQKLDSFLLVAQPIEAGSPVPSKTFTLSRPYPDRFQLTEPLQLGEYGERISAIPGTVIGTDGLPVANARVFLEGPVGGGGTYRTRTVLSDAKGQFKVDALPSPPGASYTLTAFPPASASGGPGILRTQVRVELAGDGSGTLSPSRVTCPDTVRVTGNLQTPGGRAATGVPLTAEPIQAVKGAPLPPDAVDSMTDENGRFTLGLDPGEYRLTFRPGEGQPLQSRIITVQSEPAIGGEGVKIISLPDLTLNNGRKVSGTVLSQQAFSDAISPAAYASIRFFLVNNSGTKATSVLLGQTVSDGHGAYSIVLPVR